jgi:hypothetical protein
MKNWPLIGMIGMGIVALLMGVALIGAYSSDGGGGGGMRELPSITNNNYHISTPNAADLLPTNHKPDNRTIPTSNSVSDDSTEHVHVLRSEPTEHVYVQRSEPESEPTTVYVEPVARQPRKHNIIYVQQPEPEPAPDTTIVVYKPEVRQPVHKVVVIDERFERLSAEHEARMKAWTSGPVVVVK